MGLVYFISNLKICLKKKKFILLQKNSEIIIGALNSLWDDKLILGYKQLNSFFIKVYLKFDGLGNSLIKDVLPVSTLGRKRFIKVSSLKKNYVKNNTFYLLNTSRGILNCHQAIEKNVGGEVLFKIFI